MTATESARATDGFEPVHWPDPPLQMLVLSFQTNVQIVRRAVLHVRQDGTQGRRIAFRLTRRHPVWVHRTCFDCALEEGLGRRPVTPLAEVEIDDLAMLVDGAEEVVPVLRELDGGLVHAPASTDWQTMGACGRDEAWGKGLDPVGELLTPASIALHPDPFLWSIGMQVPYLSTTQRNPDSHPYKLITR